MVRSVIKNFSYPGRAVVLRWYASCVSDRKGIQMKIIGGRGRLAASDVANFLACRRLTQLDLLRARGELRPPREYDIGFQDLLMPGSWVPPRTPRPPGSGRRCWQAFPRKRLANA